jgi:hypothetical protein
MRKWVAIGFALLVVLGLGALLGYRWWYGDPTRTFYCRVAICSDLDALDDLCGLFSEAELSGIGPSEVLDWIRAEAEKLDAASALVILEAARSQPPGSRYEAIQRAAAEEGAPRWTCPPIERALTSTTSG